MSSTPSKPLQTAVLFLVFNRPDTTTQVFEAIRKAKPPRLYIAADGPRGDRDGEAEKVAKVREIATAVDWSCEVKTLFREENLGCKYAVSGGITWFFEHEEQGIILEDDCLPDQSFFWFCDSLLDHYSEDDRVWAITGDNFQNGIKRGDGSYYLSRFNHVWGWASWRRAWKQSDMEIGFWPEWKQSKEWLNYWPDSVIRMYWEGVFDKVFRNEIDTWDYPWTASVWYHDGLTVTPNVNLVSNIGFGPDSTHTTSLDSPLAGMVTGTLSEIYHPTLIKQDECADCYTFDHAFGGRNQRYPWRILNLPRRIAGLIYRKVKISMTQY